MTHRVRLYSLLAAACGLVVVAGCAIEGSEAHEEANFQRSEVLSEGIAPSSAQADRPRIGSSGVARRAKLPTIAPSPDINTVTLGGETSRDPNPHPWTPPPPKTPEDEDQGENSGSTQAAESDQKDSNKK